MFKCIAIAAVFACSLAAQTNQPIGGVVEDSSNFYLLRVDFGDSARTLNISAVVSTNSAAGLVATLQDLDGVAGFAGDYTANAQIVAADTSSGAGSANAVLVTLPYSGARLFLLRVETSGSGSSLFTGSVSAGGAPLAIVETDSQDLTLTTPYTYEITHRILTRGGDLSSLTEDSYEVAFEVGNTARPMSVHVEFAGSDIQSFQVTRQAATGTTTLYTGNYAGGSIDDHLRIDLGLVSGTVRLKLRTTVAIPQPTSQFVWSLTLPSDAVLWFEDGDGKGGGCATSEESGAAWLGAMAALGLGLIARRLRLLPPSRSARRRGRISGP